MSEASTTPLASTTVCLVQENNGSLELHPDGIKLLTSKDLANKPVAVATVAGLYRKLLDDYGAVWV